MTFYKTELGYLHHLTQLVFLVISNNPEIRTPDIIEKVEDKKGYFKVMTQLLEAGAVESKNGGWIVKRNSNQDLI